MCITTSMSTGEYDQATVQVVRSDQVSSRATTAALSASSQLRRVILHCSSAFPPGGLLPCSLPALSSSPPFHPPAHSITCSLGWPCSVTAADCSDGPNVLGGRRVLVERHDVSMESCQPQRQRVSALVMIHCIQPQRLNAWPTTTHCGHCQPAHHTPYHTREGQRQCIER